MIALPSRRLLSANGGVMRQEGWRGNSLACGGSIGPGELSLELPGHEAPEGFQRTPLEDANHLIARPCRVCFTVPGLPADHPDVLRPAELGGLPDPRHGVGSASLDCQITTTRLSLKVKVTMSYRVMMAILLSDHRIAPAISPSFISQ